MRSGIGCACAVLAAALGTACSAARPNASVATATGDAAAPTRTIPAQAPPLPAPTEPALATPPAAGAPAPAPSTAVLEAVQKATAELGVLGAIVATEPRRVCEGAVCRWSFTLKPAVDGGPGAAGDLLVAEASNEVTISGSGSITGEHPVAAFIARTRLEQTLLGAVDRSAEVSRLCLEAHRQGAQGCVVYTLQSGALVCPPGVTHADPCLWEVYVGTVMGGHSSRIVSFAVDPGTFALRAASDLACSGMSLAVWRKRHAASGRGVALPDDCPP